MKATISLIILASISVTVLAQQPFESIGKEDKVLTLSNGQFQEVSDASNLVKVGSVMVDRTTGSIAYFIEFDTVYSEATLEPEVTSRWWSQDPLAAEFPSWSPYNFAEGNPIFYIDPDGKAVIASISFKNGRNTMSAFQILLASEIAKQYLSQFASSNGIFTSETPGSLSRHNINFTTEPDGGFGLTTLMFKDANGEFVEFEEGSTLSEDVVFQIDIGLKQWRKVSDKNTGYNATTLNHEIFAHTGALVGIIERWENRADNGMTVEQLQTELTEWLDQTEPEHDNLRAGKNETYNQVYKQLRQHLNQEVQNASSEEAKSKAAGQLKGVNSGADDDVPGISKEP